MLKEIGFGAIAAFVTWLFIKFLPPFPGIRDYLILEGIAAVIFGFGAGFAVKKFTTSWMIVTIVILLAICALSFRQLIAVGSGAPGPSSENWAYFWASLSFFPLGLGCKLAGVSLDTAET